MLEQKKDNFWVVWLGLLGLVASVVVVSVATHEPERGVDKARNTPPPSLGVAPYVPPERKAGMTMADYHRIKSRMTYAEVVNIIGFPGTEDAASEVMGIEFKSYTWINPDHSVFTATFTNDRLDVKAQHGLK